ncbi:hypothetical protein NSS71_08625 [Niallia sp. FSL W8-0951]|uniref:hypothetical protein n=1 Tax=Niallia TaxID=2837506 RepID=UPI0026EAE4FE|nr:hypothetical protein [Niallia circulans]
MKIYQHKCKSCNREYKGVNKFPSICTECKRIIIEWYSTIDLLIKEGMTPETVLEKLKLSPPK